MVSSFCSGGAAHKHIRGRCGYAVLGEGSLEGLPYPTRVSSS
jgi:hypothetical protein